MCAGWCECVFVLVWVCVGALIVLIHEGLGFSCMILQNVLSSTISCCLALLSCFDFFAACIQITAWQQHTLSAAEESGENIALQNLWPYPTNCFQVL